jgi:hypothetical protein
MSTRGEQAARVREDAGWQHGERVRVVLEYRNNGHRIEQTLGEWHEIKQGDTRLELEIEALQKALDKREDEQERLRHNGGGPS